MIDPTTQLIFNFFAPIGVAIAGWALKNQYVQGQRLSGLEGEFRMFVSIQSGRMLHSPHSPELDKLIDRYVEHKRGNALPLTSEEVIDFLLRLNNATEDKDHFRAIVAKLFEENLRKEYKHLLH